MDEGATLRSYGSDMVLGVHGDTVIRRDGVWHTHHSLGRIVELLAPRFDEVRYYAGRAVGPAADTCYYPLTQLNIRVCPGPTWYNSLRALRRPDRLLRYYWRVVRSCDVLFLRGSWPLIWVAHWLARLHGRRVVHWVVTNPLALMRGEQRGYGTLIQRIGVLYAMFERSMTHLGMRASRAHVVANGTELARLYQSRRTLEVVSTSITEEDFLVRNDTCSGPAIRLLFVGFIRPEKGIEYLIRALPLVDAGKPIQLALVGSWDKFSSERDRLVALIGELGLTDMVSWENHAPFGRPLFDRMDRSDILVLPSLSEGTPRVLVEARARSLPIVSTLAGGIPDSVCDGEDGLLVPPRDAVALASAISRLVTDGALRRRLIRRGRERVKGLTVGHFADLVAGLLADTGTGGWEGVCSCGCLTMNGR